MADSNKNQLVIMMPDEMTIPFIPNCPSLFGGFADRLKGLLFALRLANQHNIRLCVYWKKPLPFEEIFEFDPNKIDLLCEIQAKSILESHNCTILNLIDQPHDQILAAIDKFNAQTNQTTVIFANQFMPLKNGDRKTQLHETFKSALDFSESVKAKARALCPVAFEPRNQPVMGLQLRIGQYAGSPWNDPFIDSKLNFSLMRKVACRKVTNQKSAFFIADAADLSYCLNAQKGLNDLSPKWTSGNVHFELSRKASLSSILDTLAQFYLLTRCSLIVHGRGEFGFLAAAIGGGNSLDYLDDLSKTERLLFKLNKKLSKWNHSLYKRNIKFFT